MIKQLYFAALFLYTTIILPGNKIVYFISPPRSLSVAFLRMIQARGDFIIMHEPSQYVFNKINSPDLVQNWFRPDAFQSFNQVKTAILEAAHEHNVFVKEMSFAVKDFHINDHELMQNPNVYFIFLIRNTHHTTISMYKKLMNVFDTVAHQMPDIIGYKALYEIFTAVKQHAIHQPYVICTEDLYNNPQETVKKFCNHVNIEFKSESLHWNDLGEQFDAQEQWHEAKFKELTHHWHGDAIRSTGFGKPASYELDAQGNPTFSEITNPEHRELCKKVYLEHLPYYQIIKNFRIEYE